MARTQIRSDSFALANAIGDAPSEPPPSTEPLTCSLCSNDLACVEQNRRDGAWLGSYICPRCRSEYFYAYRWGRLLRKN